jgi:hypothetical protein
MIGLNAEDAGSMVAKIWLDRIDGEIKDYKIMNVLTILHGIENE